MQRYPHQRDAVPRLPPRNRPSMSWVMSSETTRTPSADTTVSGGPSDRLRVVQIWLYGMAVLIAVMVVVGGATRLTDSGLSITEWQLISGVLPPFGEAAWLAAFEKYKQIPEYQLVNRGMSLGAFKAIYWWEWGHRFLGRAIGLAFLLPFLFFWMRGYLTRPLIPKLAAMFVLGALQGALGWYMVQSGLAERVDVSQYRLAAHLSLAVALFGYMLWVAFDLRPWRVELPDIGSRFTQGVSLLLVLVFLQIVLGAFVAGLDAGQGYNTWPLMDGAIVPDGLLVMTPAWRNFFENAMTVQFEHRMLAYVITVAAAVYCLALLRRAGSGPVLTSAGFIMLIVAIQVALGIATLIYQVPIDLALCHQVGALVLLAAMLNHLHMLAKGT